MTIDFRAYSFSRKSHMDNALKLCIMVTIIHSKQTPVAGVVWFENDYRQTDVVFLDEYGELSVNNIWEKIDKFEVSEN